MGLKKIISFFLVLMLTLSMTFLMFGCNDEPQATRYVINKSDTIYIGALLPLSGDYVDIGQKVSDGAVYAHSLADSIKLDKKYKVELIVKDSSNLVESANELIKSNVSAVICVGGNKENTIDIIGCFDGYDIALIFVDNNSSAITGNSKCFTLATGYSYQVSAVCADATALGYSRGAVICCEDDSVFSDTADLFENTFSQSSGTITKYYKSGESANYSVKAVTAGEYDFVSVFGNTVDCKAVAKELTENGVTAAIYMSEVADKSMLENSELTNVRFINKLEFDDDNFVGSVFMNNYSESQSKSISKITSAEGYGYDSYMLIYEALHRVSGNILPIYQPEETTAAAEGEDNNDFTSYDVINAISGIEYYGATDTISFKDNGSIDTGFLYIDKLNGKHSDMLKKYNFKNN